jgi:hypothetical protein
MLKRLIAAPHTAMRNEKAAAELLHTAVMRPDSPLHYSHNRLVTAVITRLPSSLCMFESEVLCLALRIVFFYKCLQGCGAAWCT